MRASDILAAAVNPSPEAIERQGAWQREHPAAVAAIWLLVLSGILPAIALGIAL